MSDLTVAMTCGRCGGDDVGREAAVRWNESEQRWEISTIYDDSDWCEDCNGDTEIKEIPLA